jgi:signal transduction histidine kinase
MATRFKFKPRNLIADSGQESFAVGRMNHLLARIFAIGSLAVGIQMLLNAWSQRDLINPWFFWPGFGLVLIAQIGLSYGAFVSGKNVFWQRLYARSIEGVIVTWFLAFPQGYHLANGLYPWAWWGVGLAAVGAFAGLPPFRAILFFVVLDSFWFIARFFPAYGGVGFWLNVQDTLLTFLFAAVLGSLILVTRYEASRVDEAAARKLSASVEQARTEAATREKSRLDALVHDKVLTTLLLAAQAKTPSEQQAAATLAITAISKLNETVVSGEEISGQSLFAALEKIALTQDSKMHVHRTDVEAALIPSEVAAALTEAMLQAVVNSQQHAGSNAIRELHLKGHRNGLKIVIKDDGRGFRMSRVPKNRLGLRVSIIERIEAVGGRAFIDSRPGAGTNIILEWGGVTLND